MGGPGRRALTTTLMVLGGLGLGAAVWGFGIEPGRLVVHEERLALPGWPASLAGLRLVVLSDLHVGAPHISLSRLREVVDRTNELAPDLVLITGDLVITEVLGGRFVEPEPIAAELGRLRPQLGTYVVLGNHDWYYDGPRIIRALGAAGLGVLENEAHRIERPGGAALWVAGVSDEWTSSPRIDRALEPIKDAAPVLLFTHNPDLFPEVPARVALTLAGHTHGGQVVLPFVGAMIVPSRYGDRYAAGHVVEGGRHLYVSSGIGTSIIPVRFGVPPEITLLYLDP